MAPSLLTDRVLTAEALDDLGRAVIADTLKESVEVDRDLIEDHWLASEVYAFFLDSIEREELLISSKKRAEGKNRTRKTETDEDRDNCLLELLLDKTDKDLWSDVLLVAERLRDLWTVRGSVFMYEPALFCWKLYLCMAEWLCYSSLGEFNSKDGDRVKYMDGARSSICRWALQTPSTTVSSELSLPNFINQNYMLVMGYAFTREMHWRQSFKKASEKGQTVALKDFVKGKPDLSDKGAWQGGLYMLVSPDGSRGYLGDAVCYRVRMVRHASKGVNRYMRQYYMRPGQSFEEFHKIAIFRFDEPSSGLTSIRRILESICIAMGGLATSSDHFNINIFDRCIMGALASNLDIIKGWMAIVQASYSLDSQGLPIKLPGCHDDEDWLARFGEAFGGKLSGATICNIFRGLSRANLTSRLPQPNPEASHVNHKKRSLRAGPSEATKPEGFHPVFASDLQTSKGKGKEVEVPKAGYPKLSEEQEKKIKLTALPVRMTAEMRREVARNVATLRSGAKHAKWQKKVTE